MSVTLLLEEDVQTLIQLNTVNSQRTLIRKAYNYGYISGSPNHSVIKTPFATQKEKENKISKTLF